MSKQEIPKIQPPQQPAHSPQDDEIDLRELASAIWQGKWLILCVTTIFAIGSVFHALSIQDEYKSTAILAPVSSSSSSSLSKLAGQFGGLASLAGVNLGGGGGTDKTTIAIELMNTWGFLEAFIQKNQLEVEVFAAKGWDKSKNRLLMDEALYDEKNAKWIAHPTSWKLFEKIKKKISISQNAKTSLISLSVEHYSPYVAKRWADLLIAAINKHMQSQDRNEALRSIEYLKAQITKTDIAEMRTIFYQLIEGQTKTLMLAEISDEYVFKILSSSKVAEKKSKPKRALTVVLGTFMGGILSVFFVLFRSFVKKLKD